MLARPCCNTAIVQTIVKVTRGNGNIHTRYFQHSEFALTYVNFYGDFPQNVEGPMDTNFNCSCGFITSQCVDEYLLTLDERSWRFHTNK